MIRKEAAEVREALVEEKKAQVEALVEREAEETEAQPEALGEGEAGLEAQVLRTEKVHGEAEVLGTEMVDGEVEVLGTEIVDGEVELVGQQPPLDGRTPQSQCLCQLQGCQLARTTGNVTSR